MNLSRYEDVLFVVLKANIGEVVPRSRLEEELVKARPFHDVPEQNSNVLEVLIGRIRRKLPLGSTIKAVRTKGYVLKEIALCDSCQQHPGTRHVRVAAGTETLVCDDCHN